MSKTDAHMLLLLLDENTFSEGSEGAICQVLKKAISAGVRNAHNVCNVCKAATVVPVATGVTHVTRATGGTGGTGATFVIRAIHS